MEIKPKDRVKEGGGGAGALRSERENLITLTRSSALINYRRMETTSFGHDRLYSEIFSSNKIPIYSLILKEKSLISKIVFGEFEV